MSEVPSVLIGGRKVGLNWPTYFVAEIAANYDGDLTRAKDLIRLAAESGAQCAKFQHFRARSLVSDRGFRTLGGQMSHQARWKRSVYDVYDAAALPWDWTAELAAECARAGVDFSTSIYDLEAIELVNPHVAFHKIGSGDITWPTMLRALGSCGKPVMVASGASEIGEVQRAMGELLAVNDDVVLMQCNTNYTASADNLVHLNLRVLQTYAAMYPGVVLGLSDHMPGHTAVLGAVALGARVIEKHFTDDTDRDGPDHPFSMTGATFGAMVREVRDLERALGSPVKTVAGNERDTVVVQRRSLRAVADLPSGTILTAGMLTALRPAPLGSLAPYLVDGLIGRRLARPLAEGEHLTWEALEP